MEYTHFDQNGNAVMVDVSDKIETKENRRCQRLDPYEQRMLRKNKKSGYEKRRCFGSCRIAGIMGAKKTSELIPLCHILNLTSITVDFIMQEESCSVTAVCKAKTTGKTGVEMEALTGVQIALLTIYDMCKAVDKTMEIYGVCLCSKSGGKSGDVVYRLPEGE